MQKINTSIFKDRKRTNILRKAEQTSISWLVKQVPNSITPNILTAIGFLGSLIVLTAFVLAAYLENRYLLLGILGLAINWLGDSLDGRIAYFRGIPRKWYGFSLDIIMDWMGTVLIGMGYLIYVPDRFALIGFIFVVFYGWAMIISQLRYKITDKYSIDSGLFGPTEVRVLISLILLLEIFIPGSIIYCGVVMCLALFFINLTDTKKLLAMGDLRDNQERELKNRPSL